MIIQEFKFRITTQDRNPEGNEHQFIKVVHAHFESGAWLKCVSEVNNDLPKHEILYQVELMEVND